MSTNNTPKEKIIAIDEMHAGINYKDSFYYKEREREYREWADANPDRHDDLKKS